MPREKFDTNTTSIPVLPGRPFHVVIVCPGYDATKERVIWTRENCDEHPLYSIYDDYVGSRHVIHYFSTRDQAFMFKVRWG